MKYFRAIAVLCILLAASKPVYALPLIVEQVAGCREFFSEFNGYEDCYLYDVSKIGNERVGLVMLSPLGFEIRLVMEVKSRKTVYKDMIVPEKNKREAMMLESIRVLDAVRKRPMEVYKPSLKERAA